MAFKDKKEVVKNDDLIKKGDVKDNKSGKGCGCS